MNQELRIRCQMVNLPFDCGAGGLFGAHTAIVGEAPGERECAMRTPFSGGSGKLLWDAIRKEGVLRNQVYSTNLVKRRLITAGDHAGKPKDAIGGGEREHWAAILLMELASLPNLQYIVCLGNLALNALTGQTGITQWRGSVLYTRIGDRTIPVICTFNPAACLRDPKLEVTFKMDLGKYTRVVNKTYNVPTFARYINPSPQEAINFIETMREEGKPVALDIETMAEETACVGLANSVHEGMCINFRNQRSNRWSTADERDVRLALQGLCSDTRVKFVAQNGHFDCTWLWYKDRIKVHKVWFDTMLAHHLLYPPLPHNLGYLTSQYTDMPYYKDDGKTWRETDDIDQLWNYNVQDCITTLMCTESMQVELQKEKLDQFFYNHVMRLQPHLVWMTVGGVKCDATLKSRITEDLAREVAHKRQQFLDAVREATGDIDRECNPNSPKQLADLFFSDLKLVGRGTSTNRENRDRMLAHPRTTDDAKQVILRLNEYAEDNKFFTTYADASIDDDGRFRCEYKQTGVQSAPGRLSSSSTMWGSGLNLQNIPDRAKPMFMIDDGYEASYFDASQIEARFVAYLADIPTWKEQFELARLNPGSYDAHCALAADMFKVPYNEVPKFDRNPDGSITMRYVAKRCRHGLNYRMGPDRLATAAGLSLSQADVAYTAYHRTNPQIRDWWDATIKRVRQEHMLTSPMGRRWRLMQRLDDSALDSIIAFEPQSLAGDKVASVIYLCHDDPQWPRDARVILNIHDALIAIHRPADGVLVRSIMKKHMETPVLIKGQQLIVPCELMASTPGNDNVHRWSTLKKVAA